MTATPYPLPRETRETQILVGNGTVGPYGPTSFKVFDIADVEVWTRPQSADQFGRVEASVAKVTGAELDQVRVTFPAAVPATTEFLVISRRVHERTAAVFKGSTLNTAELEKELSKQGSVIEELRRDVNRGGSAVPGTLGQTIVFNAEGRPVPGADQSQITAAQANAASAALDASRAEEARAIAVAEAAGITIRDYPTRAAAVLATIPAIVMHVRTAGYAAVGDLGDAVYYRKTAPEADRAGDFTSANDVRFGLIKQTLRPQMFGPLGTPTQNTSLFAGMFQTALALDVKEIDATATGDFDFATSPFAGIHTLPLRFKTGDSRIRMNFNGSTFKLPSFCVWEGGANGGVTRIRPSSAITHLLQENTPASMLEAFVAGSGRTVTVSGTTATVSDATGIHVGTRIAMFGTYRDFFFQMQTGAAITASDTQIPLVNSGAGEPPANTITPGLINVRITSANGTEIVRGLYQAGVLDTTSGEGAGRGKSGTTAVAHASGSTALLLQSSVRTVTAVSGNTLTLDAAPDIAGTNMPFRFGAVDCRYEGRFDVSAEFDKTLPAPNVWSCLGACLSHRFSAKGEIILRQAPTGGIFLQGTKSSDIDIAEIVGVGNTQGGNLLGSAIWLFGLCLDDNVRVRRTLNGPLTLAVDNKSSGIGHYGVDQPCRGFSVLVDTAISMKGGLDISACHDGYAWAGYMDCTESPAGIFDGMPQQWSRIIPQNVCIEIGRLKNVRGPSGQADCVNANRVILEGRVERVISADIALASAVAVAGNSGTSINFSLTGAKIGDVVTFGPNALALPNGLSISSARISGADLLTVTFANATASSLSIPATIYRASARGPWL